ncbi:hypothetical protein FRC03_008912 [Tulasnella sp. 419]|nr:hypothetical protein FRC03_008912 [Tulasnella sp. 419]
MFLPGLVSGRLFDLGYLDAQRIPASIAMVVATFLVAECKEYWQFLLCQGIITGLGAGICYSPSVATISHWFKKKRSTAFGMSATGTAIGGTLLPIAVRKLIPSVGFKWTMRILGFILLVLLTINIALVKRRLPPINVSGGLFNWKAFKVLPYTLYVAASFLSYVGLYTVLTYIDVAGIIYGVSPDYSFYLVSIANASSLVGRVASGPICDRFGNLNVLIPSNILAAATTFAWPFCKDAKSLTILAVFYGVTFGSFASLVPAPVASLGGTGDVGRRTGMLYTFCGIACLIGPPISGAIFSRYNGFLEVGIYGGCMILGSSALMFAARWAALGGQLWGKF